MKNAQSSSNNTSVIIGIITYNNNRSIVNVLRKVSKLHLSSRYHVLIIEDASSDQTKDSIARYLASHKTTNMTMISNRYNRGIGYGIQKTLSYGLHKNFHAAVIMAGNGKDNPLEIPRLITPLKSDTADYVQGSRFLKGGGYDNLPLGRLLLIKLYTWIFYLFTGFYGTDVTNGFRAYKLSLLQDKRIKFRQSWLHRYEFETYLHYKVITLGYRIAEVAVSKHYPKNNTSYSNIRPAIDWWHIVRPLILLKMRRKQ